MPRAYTRKPDCDKIELCISADNKFLHKQLTKQEAREIAFDLLKFLEQELSYEIRS